MLRILPFCLIAAACLALPAPAMDASAGYHLAAVWPIGGPGRWDYAITDAAGRRLFLTRTTHTQVIDTATGAILGDIPGLDGAHGVALVDAVQRGFASNGDSGTVTVFDLRTYAVLGTVQAAPDADCIIADDATGQVLVFCGDAAAMIAIPAAIDLAHPSAPIHLDLGGKPEFAVADGKGRAYVALQSEDRVAVIDTAQHRVLTTYPVGPGHEPTGMAMDREHRILIIGCRNQLLVLMDADTGAVLASLPIGAGNDATAFHGGTAFASCGDGTLTMVRPSGSGTFAVAQTLVTRPSARTMAVDPISGRIFLPCADLAPAPAPSPEHPHPRPQPIPGTFAVLVVAPPGS